MLLHSADLLTNKTKDLNNNKTQTKRHKGQTNQTDKQVSVVLANPARFSNC